MSSAAYRAAHREEIAAYNLDWRTANPDRKRASDRAYRAEHREKYNTTCRAWYAERPLYRTWAQMKSRCNDPKATSYKYYGALGVTVCEQWNASDAFPVFLAYV